MQIIANAQTGEIMAVAQAKGSTHDFKLFKDTFRGLGSSIQILGDSGYQGIVQCHANSLTPIKSSKHHKLSAEEKTYNRTLAKKRILIEHINRRIKRFKILSDRYRNKRTRHGIRVTIVCAIHNFESCSQG